MKCANCPAYSKDFISTGCVVLKHSIRDYNGCNRSEEKIRSELVNWFKKTTKSEIERFEFWKTCGLDSHWQSASELKDELDASCIVEKR